MSEEATAETYTPGPDAVDITPEKDGGVLKEIKRAGSDVDGSPQKGETVSVHYVGTLTDGSKFDSSRDRGELFEFKLGQGQVIKAWDLGVATMKKGELAVLTCKADYAYGAAGSPPKIPPNATLVFEVELFHWKGEDLSPDKDGSILRSELEKGEGFTTPNEGATCEIHIAGKHEGRTFEERDVTFVIGEGADVGIVEGVEVAVQKFKAGEKSRLTIKSPYAYGVDGNKELGVPPNADLVYEVTLKNFEKCKESWEMNTQEKLEQSEIMKQKGTDFFKAAKYKLALNAYKKIIDYLDNESESADEDEQKTKIKTLLLAANLNIAMCHLKVKDDFEARLSCDKVLELEPNSEKAFFRRGTACQNLKDYEQAIKDFQKCLDIDASNKAAKNQLAVSKAKLQQIKDKERKTYAGMFSKFAEIDAKKEAAKSAENGQEAAVKEPEGKEAAMEVESPSS